MAARFLKQASVALALVLAGPLAPLATAQGSPLRHGRIPLGGVNVAGIDGDSSFAAIDAEIAAAHQLHAQIVRVEMPWAAFEPSAPGRIDTHARAAADRLMRDAAVAHIEAIALLDRTPCWAISAPVPVLRSCSPSDITSEAHAWPPRSSSSFAAFAAWVARRYGSQLAAIEVWNEPDQINQHYLAGPAKPQHYAGLLRAAYPAIKRADLHLPVLAGSLVGSNGAFLDALYAAGIKGYYDGLAVHFYDLTLASLRDFRNVEVSHGDHKPLWLDEFGWSSCWPARRIEQEQACVTRRVQAQDVFSSLRELTRAPYLAADSIYTLRDSRDEAFGLLTRSGRRKPSFYALSSVLRSPFGRPPPVTLSLRASRGRVIASGSAPVGDYMKLEAFQHGVLRYRTIFTLNRFNDYSIGLPSVLGSHGLTVRVYQYWLGPGQGAQRSI